MTSSYKNVIKMKNNCNSVIIYNFRKRKTYILKFGNYSNIEKREKQSYN